MAARRKIEELTYFNAICCFLVILIHVLSYSVTNCEKPSALAAFVFVPWKTAAFAVPAFLFSGAMKMAAGFNGSPLENYGSYLLGRLKKIVLPYAFWNVIYYAVFIMIGYESFSVTGFIRSLALGTLSAQFYYVIIVLQFYLLRPLWQIMTEKIPVYIAVPFSALVTYFSMQTDTTLAHFGIEFAYSDRLFTTYLVFWTLGLYAGKNADGFTKSLENKRRWMPLALVGIGAFVFVAYVQYSRPVWLFNLTFYKMFSDVLSVFVLFALCTSIVKAKGMAADRTRHALTFVHSASYSVYLSHCLFLTIAKKLVIDAGYTRIGIVTVSTAIVCATVPFALYAAEAWVKKKVTKKA